MALEVPTRTVLLALALSEMADQAETADRIASIHMMYQVAGTCGKSTAACVTVPWSPRG